MKINHFQNFGKQIFRTYTVLKESEIPNECIIFPSAVNYDHKGIEQLTEEYSEGVNFHSN